MIQYIIFDLDGTLVNSIFDLQDAVNHTLESHGYPTHETDEYYYYVGNGTLKLVERAMPKEKRTEENVLKLHKEFADYYGKNYKNKTVMYDGIDEMLFELDKRGIKYAVASNKTDSFTNSIIKELIPNHRFDKVMGKKEGNPTKPDPKIVYDVLNGKNLEKSEILFVGDSNVDILTGHNAGIKSVGCLWGFRDKKELTEANADYIIASPQELLNII